MIEKILSRLEKIDHKEYSCAFEFADSSTFDEMCRCFEERKILAKEIERLHSIIEQIEGALYNTNLSNMYCRITIQEILDKGE